MPQRRPNILWIMTDQQRYDALGANGNPHIRTPNLDRLAAESANLSNCFVQAPVCVPSRQTFFTGRYPHCHRNRVNYTPLAQSETLIQARLRDAGYATGFVGKLHYYPPTREHALSTGFDHGLLHDAGQCDGHSDYVRWLTERDPTMARQYRRTRTDSANPYRTILPDALHETTWCGQQTRDMLTQFAGQDRPFFLFSSYWKPHPSFELPDPWASMYDDVEIPLPDPVTLEQIHTLPLPVQKMVLRGDSRVYQTPPDRMQWMYRAYYGAVTQIDHEVGLTLDLLSQLNLERETVVIFCSDHGDQMFEHGMRGKNVFYEGSVHVPLLIRWPDVVRPARYIDLVESTDVLPTLFDCCCLDTPPGNQGQSFAGRITHDSVGSPYRPRDYVFAENVIPEVITEGNLNHFYQPGQGVNGIVHPDAKMVRDRRWKYCYYVDHGHELYDLETDPHETINRADDPACRDRVQAMRAALLDWLITADERDQIAPRWCDV